MAMMGTGAVVVEIYPSSLYSTSNVWTPTESSRPPPEALTADPHPAKAPICHIVSLDFPWPSELVEFARRASAVVRGKGRG